jgi:Holliday junction DNA helicase RuvA
MISALTGELKQVEEDRVRVQAGAMLFELLVPSADIAALTAGIGQEITFHTIFDLEGDPTRGGLSPRLIGFLRLTDKQFFELFTTVKGIGPKKALRALSVPVERIARAIESKNASELSRLDGIGKRMAEQIVAALSGKAEPFAVGSAGALGAARSPGEEEAILVCVQLGISRSDAERLLEKVKHDQPELVTAEVLSRQMLRLRTAPA